MSNLSPDGSQVLFLTGSTAVGFCGARDPDAAPRDRLAVVDVGKKQGVFVYVDGVHRISEPVWAPGGDRTAFTGVKDKGNRDIFVVTLKHPVGLSSRDVPCVSPTIRRAMSSRRGLRTAPRSSTTTSARKGLDDSGFSSTQEIWSVPADGGAPQRLTHNAEADVQPDVSSAEPSRTGTTGRSGRWTRTAATNID